MNFKCHFYWHLLFGLLFQLIIFAIFQSRNRFAELEQIFEQKEKVDWVIGILSSREHFEQRSTIRQTWLADLDDLEKQHDVRIRSFFVVANSMCALDCYQQLKSNEFSCDETFLKDSLKKGNSFRTHKLEKLNEKAENRLYQGFIFETNWNLTITRFGILKDVLKKENEVTISLVDLLIDKLIVSKKYNQSEWTEDDYVYFDLEEPINLKKGSTCQIYLENKLNRNYPPIHKSIQNDNFNLVKILDLTDSDFTVLNDLDNYLTAVSFQYEFTDVNKVTTAIESIDQESCLKKQQLIDRKLKKELKNFNDIYFTNNKETYRNIPEKLLQFISYVDHEYSFEYLIKSDDDTFLNLDKILQNFKGLKTDNKKSWFGKKNWQVNKWGKWLEPNYQSVVYPPFACGSAYVLKHDLVSWLSKNGEYLFRYQGEDVSMGIWLSSVLPNYKNDERWNCDKHSVRTDKEFFSVGQLSTEDQIRIFKL